MSEIHDVDSDVSNDSGADFDAADAHAAVDDAFAALNQDLDEEDDDSFEDDADEERVRKSSSTSLHANPVFSMKRPSIDVPFALKRPSVDVPFITQPTIPEDPVPSPCPFKEMPDHNTLVRGLKTLPEFEDGCVFKETSDMKEVVEKMESMAQSSEAFGNALKAIVDEASKPSKEVPDDWVDVVELVKTEGVRICESLDRARWDIRAQAEATLRETVAAQPTRELSDALKEDTQEAHRRAETCEFMHAFMRGSVTKELYREFLGNMYYVYEAMEEEMERHRDNAVLQTIHFPTELDRVEFMDEDLRFYYGDDWKDQFVMSEGGRNYVARIRELGNTEPELIVAHHYTRYLGDISGGQTLKKKAQKAWALETDEDENRGIMFYYFPHVPNPNNFKRMYRARLNVIGEDDPALAARIVEESNRVYDFNTDLFKEMDEMAKKINGFSNVRPDLVQEQKEIESSAYSNELKQRKPICPVMSGKIPLDDTKEMSNPHAAQSTVTSAQCPIHSAGNKLLRGIYHVAEPVIVMAVASLMTIALHASDVI